MIREAVLISLLISSVIGKEKAILEIVMHRSTGNGEYTTEIEKIVGHFTSAGSTVSAEGPILQIHPLSICSQEYLTEKMEYGWVGVMKLEIIQAPCMPLYQQAKKAIQRGATAVVFDITDVPEAAIQLKSSLSYQLDRPVIVLRGNQAAKLMRIIRTLENARARIRLDQSKEMETVVNTKEYFDMGIFVAVFVLFCIICIIVVLKLKWRHREQQLSMPELAKRAISKLKTRKYQFPSAKLLRVQTPVSDVYSQSSGLEQCAICLEEYKEGQILRVLPCSHEFHKVCVDPWLVSHGTCPLCLFNIVADQNSCTEEVQPTHHESDLGQSRMYDALSTNPYNVVRAVEHTTYQQSPQPDYLDYLRSDGARSVGRTLVHHVRHMDSARFPRGCPSCEGTMGSSPSSCSSYFGGFHPILSTRGMSVEHTYQNTAEIRCPQTYHRTCCGCSEIRRSHTHRNSHSHHLLPRLTNNPHKIPMCNSGISYSQYLANHSLCRSFHHHGNSFHPHTTTYTHEKFHKFTCNRVKAPGKMWESDPECSGGSVRDSSIAAQYGSCSSDSTCDRNPSNCSLESEYCSQCRIAPIDSAHSTYGSSDVKDVSDSASCDSNVFYSGAPDQMCTDVSSDKTSISENVVQTCSANKCSCHKYRVTENDENACTCTSSNVCDINSRGSNSSTLNLSDISNFCDSIYSSKETVEVFCRECNSVSPDLSLSNISGITTYVSTEDLFSESSHIIASEHSISLPKNITSVNGSEGVLNTQHDGNTDSVHCDPDEHDIHCQSKSAPQCNRTSDSNCSRKMNSCDSHVPLTLSQILKCNYCDGNTSSQTGADNSSAPWQGCLQSGSQDVEDKCFQQYPECIRCRTKAVIPRQSMVVYSEPQGAITIPLQTKEVYGPKNAV